MDVDWSVLTLEAGRAYASVFQQCTLFIMEFAKEARHKLLMNSTSTAVPSIYCTSSQPIQNMHRELWHHFKGRIILPQT
jgi:hypothetical protein